MPKIIAFDADDTLWMNEPFFRETEQRIAALLEVYQPQEQTHQELYQTITGNLPLYGYGVKSCVLSMLEYVSTVQNNIPSTVYQEIVGMGKQMLQEPVELLPSVQETLEELSKTHTLIICTKGDLLDQQNKIERSGLAKYFDHIEVVSDKNKQAYLNIIERLNIKPQDFLMIGNSLKSDVLPVLEIGGQAIYIPFGTIWKHETITPARLEHHQYTTLKSIDQLIDHLH